MSKEISRRIIKLAEDKGMSQTELAEIINVHSYIIGDWESGLREPTIGNIVKVSDYFSVT